MWAALKSGDIDLWDEHVKKFVETERVVYSMLHTQIDETKYEARIKAVIEARVKAIKAPEITPENAQKAPVLLANLACEIGMGECSALVPDNVTASGLDNAFDSQYTLALEKDWTDAEAGSIRVPYGLRKLALDTLAPTATLPTEAAVYQKFLKSAAILKLVRTTGELQKVKAEAASKGGIPDTVLQALEASLVSVNAPLREWIYY
ncbi:uncharacterized protein [Dermacentor andersoni]|uniref:uncharacterized protein isoform X3 n=1 Tax=Dermacentor andersoni TaxID=34620 RepID=UPI003B3B2F02